MILPEPSVTVHITLVFPKGNAIGALFVTEEIMQLSEVMGVPKEIPVALQALLVAVIIVGGHVIVGFILSLIVTD